MMTDVKIKIILRFGRIEDVRLYFDMLGSFLARPCEQAYAGCTELYKDILSKNHNTWITGKVFGYLGKGW